MTNFVEEMAQRKRRDLKEFEAPNFLMSDVIRAIGISKKNLENHIARMGTQLHVEPIGRGYTRLFREADAVIFAVLRKAVSLGIPPTAAVRIATAVRKWASQPDVILHQETHFRSAPQRYLVIHDKDEAPGWFESYAAVEGSLRGPLSGCLIFDVKAIVTTTLERIWERYDLKPVSSKHQFQRFE